MQQLGHGPTVTLQHVGHRHCYGATLAWCHRSSRAQSRSMKLCLRAAADVASSPPSPTRAAPQSSRRRHIRARPDPDRAQRAKIWACRAWPDKQQHQLPVPPTGRTFPVPPSRVAPEHRRSSCIAAQPHPFFRATGAG
jgi:hypothetical protein